MSEPRRETAVSAMSGGGIRYSQVWEDHRLLEEGLHVGPEDDVLSVTSAGDNVLALLLRGPRSVTALDCNPAQQAMLELKLAAARTLEHEEFACLLGLRAYGGRAGLYRAVRERLSSGSRSFFDANGHLLEAGLADCGRFESYVRKFREEHFERLVPSDAVRALLRASDLDMQRRIFDEAIRPVEPAFRAFFGREELSREGRSAEQFQFVGQVDVGLALWRRFEYACTEIPARGNFYLEYLLTWRYANLDDGPPYLRPANYGRLRDLADRVRIVTEDIGTHLDRLPPGTYSKANLSDVFEYLSADGTVRLMRGLARALRPGGRMAYWNLLVPRESPAELRPPFRHLDDLSHALWRRDRSWFYQAFHVEEIVEP